MNIRYVLYKFNMTYLITAAYLHCLETLKFKDDMNLNTKQWKFKNNYYIKV